MNYFSKNLKYLLKRFGVKQGELAEQVGKKQTTISNWINEVSEPDVSQLLIIHHYFGISLDALVKTDLEKLKVVADSHVEEFKKFGKAKREVPDKKSAASRQYFIEDDPKQSILSEPDPVANWAVMGQLKQIHEKLDDLKDSLQSINKK